MKNFKKWIALALIACLAFALAACGGKEPTDDASAADPTAATNESTENTTAEEADPYVDSIDLELDDGIIKYVRFEKANEDLTDTENAYIFVFDYTNKQALPAQAQSTFTLKFYQNGAELNTGSSYSSKGGDQYDLVGAFFNEALKDGTVTFGKIVSLTDDSPVTIMARRNGGEDAYQMMEVDITADAPQADETSADMTAEEVDAAVQGTWILQGSNYFTFENGALSVVSGGNVINGTYEINVEEATVDGKLTATDGIVNIHMPYAVEDGVFVLYNNAHEVLEKQ